MVECSYKRSEQLLIISCTLQEKKHSHDVFTVPPLITLEGIMATLRAALFVTAVFLCRVNGQFSVTIPCPSSGEKTLMSVTVYILYRY